jgi:hypothetical protein
MIKKFFTLLFFLICLGWGCPRALAGPDGLHVIAEGKYFTVWGYQGIDVKSIAAKLKFDYFLHPDNLLEPEGGNRNVLAKSIDAIYLETSDILDIHSYNYHGRIKIVLGQKEVETAFKRVYGRDFPERSVYLLKDKTIYISGQDMTLGMLGHEIAHAIMNHYFVVPPSVKMQEILAGYVEYTLMKKTSSLPKSGQVRFE